MDWKLEARLVAASDLTLQGKAAYAAARWSVTRWANSDRLLGKRYTARLRSGEEVVLRGGTSDVLVFRELFLENCYRAAFDAIDVTGDKLRILDCGANIGLFAVLCARHFRSPCLVCVEPDRGNLEMLQTNVAGLRAEIKTVAAFLGGSNGLGYLDDCGAGEWGFKLSRTPVVGVEPASVLDVPSLMKIAGWERIDLLKMDIEGAEVEVFAKSEGWIDSVNSMIVELHGGYSTERFVNDISRFGRNWKLNYEATYGDQTVCSVTRDQR
jgi:FkbM family methyltransferase